MCLKEYQKESTLSKNGSIKKEKKKLTKKKSSVQLEKA